ncbi:hypothetical protein [Massilia timonae]|nr:hypothetical protein [Massilia timonae]
MRRLRITTGAMVCAAMAVAASGPARAGEDAAPARLAPAADHHQHLFSPAAAA